jgi:slit protein 2
LAYQQASPCQAAPCRHGSCLASGPGEFSCRCNPGYSGKRCEYLTTVQLAGHRPYLQLDPLYTNRPLNLTLVLKTTESSGVLLYHGDSDHLAVELFHGRVRVSLNVGNPPASTMFSYAVLNDDRPHAVELLLSGRNLTMRVDGGLARSLINMGSREVLSVASPTFLGGLPEDVGEKALAQWHLRNSTSLRGCVTNFYIDDKTIDFLQAAHQRPGVLAGCFQRYLTSSVALADSETGPDWPEPRREGGRGRKGRGRVGRQKEGCEDHRCRETGTRGCSPRSGGNYRCRCKRGYAGRYCERGAATAAPPVFRPCLCMQTTQLDARGGQNNATASDG